MFEKLFLKVLVKNLTSLNIYRKCFQKTFLN